jgi:hypothetical protein
MSNELHDCAYSGDLEGVKHLVESGADLDKVEERGMTALMLAITEEHFDIVVYIVEHGGNVAHVDRFGMTALHWASQADNLPAVTCLLEHGARITERNGDKKTALLLAAESASLGMVQFLLSSEGGARITEADNEGKSALLLAAAGDFCHADVVQWLLEFGGAQITDMDEEGNSVWSDSGSDEDLPCRLIAAYEINDNDKEIPTSDAAEMTALLRVMVLHGGPPKMLMIELPLPLLEIVKKGERLRTRLPAYLAQRRALLDMNCPLLSPLCDLVHGYEEPTTTDELWATGLGRIIYARSRVIKHPA